MNVLPDFLEDAIDLHVHSAPDVDVRRFNDLDLAREAERAGMGAILIKSHQNSTVERAWLVSKVVTGIKVFGGLVLNETVGGLNVAAVKLALAMGAKEIWMPTRSALNHRLFHGESGGITVLDAGGGLVPAAQAILETVAQTDCILSTGHLSPREAVVLIHQARQCGVRKVLARISHHDCLWDTFGWAARLLLCICVLLLTGRSNFRPVRSCLGVSGVVFCMALPGPVTWAKVEV
jgi:hypothetical protein